MLPAPTLTRLAAALIALLALLATPACTLNVWCDNRTVASTPIAEAPELGAWRLPGDPAAFVLQLPAATVGALRAHVPELPANVEWLEVRLCQDASKRLDQAVRRGGAWPIHVAAFRDPLDAPVVWSFDPCTHIKTPAAVDYGAYYLEAACDVAVLPAPPAARGDAIAVELTCATRNDDGTAVGVRIALTPLALAADAAIGVCIVAAGAVMIALLPVAWPIHELTKSDDDRG